MCNLGKKRVRDAARWPANDARRARAAAARAALPSREGSRRASKHGVRNALEEVVESYPCNKAAAHALEELQKVVDSQLAHRWKDHGQNSLARCRVVRQQLLCASIMTRPELVAAAKKAVAALCASAPPCPRCGQPLSAHVRSEWDVSVNRYRVGSGLCVHLDEFEGMALLVALPGEGTFSGGFLRVAPHAGAHGVCIREGCRSAASAPLKRARDLVMVPMPPYHCALFDGHVHAHEVSEVTAGVRYSFVLGFKCADHVVSQRGEGLY